MYYEIAMKALLLSMALGIVCILIGKYDKKRPFGVKGYILYKRIRMIPVFLLMVSLVFIAIAVFETSPV